MLSFMKKMKMKNLCLKMIWMILVSFDLCQVRIYSSLPDLVSFILIVS